MPQSTVPPRRRLYRASDRRIIGGVARGLADHLGVDVLWIRLGFLLLIPAGGCGLVLYAVFWAVTPLAVSETSSRPAQTRSLLEALGIIRISFALVLALALASAGVAVLWRQVDDAQRGRWLGGGRPWVR